MHWVLTVEMILCPEDFYCVPGVVATGHDNLTRPSTTERQQINIKAQTDSHTPMKLATHLGLELIFVQIIVFHSLIIQPAGFVNQDHLGWRLSSVVPCQQH